MATEETPKRRVTIARPKAAIDKLSKVRDASDATEVLGKQGLADLDRAIKAIEKVVARIEEVKGAA